VSPNGAHPGLAEHAASTEGAVDIEGTLLGMVEGTAVGEVFGAVEGLLVVGALEQQPRVTPVDVGQQSPDKPEH